MNRYEHYFAERLKRLITDTYDDDINELSRCTGIPIRTIKSYLYEGHTPSLENLWKIHENSGESIDWLLGMSNIRHPNM